MQDFYRHQYGKLLFVTAMATAASIATLTTSASLTAEIVAIAIIAMTVIASIATLTTSASLAADIAAMAVEIVAVAIVIMSTAATMAITSFN